MANIFVIADTHFGHAKSLSFVDPSGLPLRPFSCVEEMDETIVTNWNNTVGNHDTVYHLGDVVMPRPSLKVLTRLNGRKILIRGNHDIFKLEDYTEHFRDVRGYHVMNGLILSHVPVHAESLARFGANIHGHLHANRVMKARGVDARTGEVLYSDEIDVRYHCVCVEQTPDFAPILFEDVLKRIQEEGGVVGFRNGNGPTM